MQNTIWKPKEKQKGNPASRYPFFHLPIHNFKKTTEIFLVKGRGGTGTDLSSLVTSDRTRGLMLCQGRFRVLGWVLETRFFTQRIVEGWDELHKKVATA